MKGRTPVPGSPPTRPCAWGSRAYGPSRPKSLSASSPIGFEGGPFRSMSELAHRVGISTDQAEGPRHRRRVRWLQIDPPRGALGRGHRRHQPARSTRSADQPRPSQRLPQMSAPEQLMADLWATGITRGLLPHRADPRSPRRARHHHRQPAAHARQPHPGSPSAASSPIASARPPPAGFTFINLEDETGMVNVICDATVWGRHRKVARDSGGLVIRGMLERARRG